jgi:predicted DNA-binding transcriptional regulator AlpA
MKNDLLVTLTTNELRNIISELLDEKLIQHQSQKKIPKNDASLISRLEVSKLFGVSPTSIDKWRRYKILPPVIKIASRIYFDKQKVMDLIERKNRNNISK